MAHEILLLQFHFWKCKSTPPHDKTNMKIECILIASNPQKKILPKPMAMPTTPSPDKFDFHSTVIQ